MRQRVEGLRLKCASGGGDAQEETENAFRIVFSSYCSTISSQIAEIFHTLRVIMGPGAQKTQSELSFRLQQLAAEQPGRERAFLCGHLDRPESLRIPRVLIELAQIIGARKV